MLGLPYPGGPAIEKLARKGNAKAHQFPRAYLEKASLDFSFSGLKTSVRTFLNQREKDNRLTLTDEDISAGFQDAVLLLFLRLQLFMKIRSLAHHFLFHASCNNTLSDKHCW